MTPIWMINNMKLLMGLGADLNRKQVVIYGANPAGYLVAALLEELSVSCRYYVDHGPGLIGRRFHGKLVRGPRVLAAENADALIVLLCGVYFDTVRKPLERMGLERGRHFFSMDMIGYPETFATIRYVDLPGWFLRLIPKLAIIDGGRIHDYMAILKTIDFELFEPTRRTYAKLSLKEAPCDVPPFRAPFTIFPTSGYNRFVNIEHFLAVDMMKAYCLGLDCVGSKRILDLGTGCGYFPYVCKYFGHEPIALDMDTTPLFNDMCSFLAIERKTWTIKAFEPLPPSGPPVDLVTAYHAAFYNTWDVTAWDFFLTDLSTRHLTSTGRALFELPVSPSPSLTDYFNRKGAKLWRNFIYFPSFKAF